MLSDYHCIDSNGGVKMSWSKSPLSRSSMEQTLVRKTMIDLFISIGKKNRMQQSSSEGEKPVKLRVLDTENIPISGA